MMQGQWRTNICFDCQKAVCGCSWSKNFTPIPGWTAEPSVLTGFGKRIETYHITECPEFVPDEDRKVSSQALLAKQFLKRR